MMSVVILQGLNVKTPVAKVKDQKKTNVSPKELCIV